MMISNNQKNIIKQEIILISYAIILLIIWITYFFFQKLKEEERTKMEIWAVAMAEFLQTTDLDKNLGDLAPEVIRTNKSTPMILMGNDGKATSNNLDSDKADDQEYLKKKIAQFEKQNTPIRVRYKSEKLGTLYYGNSDVLSRLKFYPLALILIIVLFSTLV